MHCGRRARDDEIHREMMAIIILLDCRGGIGVLCVKVAVCVCCFWSRLPVHVQMMPLLRRHSRELSDLN